MTQRKEKKAKIIKSPSLPNTTTTNNNGVAGAHGLKACVPVGSSGLEYLRSNKEKGIESEK